jgi:hypothetical protein
VKYLSRNRGMSGGNAELVKAGHHVACCVQEIHRDLLMRVGAKIAGRITRRAKRNGQLSARAMVRR